MKYERTSVIDLCNYLNGTPIAGLFKHYGKFTKFEMFDFIKEKTSNFDISLFKYLIQDIRGYIWEIPITIYNETGYPKKSDYKEGFAHSCEPLGRYLLEKNIKFYFEKNQTFKQRIDKLIDIDLIADVDYPPLHKLIEFSDIAESEYKRVIESTPDNSESINNTKTKLQRRQKIALLESVGVMKFLESNVFAGNQTQMAKFLSLIIDCDQQNIRADINCNVPEFLLNDKKIIKVIQPILTDLGIRSKE